MRKRGVDVNLYINVFVYCFIFSVFLTALSVLKWCVSRPDYARVCSTVACAVRKKLCEKWNGSFRTHVPGISVPSIFSLKGTYNDTSLTLPDVHGEFRPIKPNCNLSRTNSTKITFPFIRVGKKKNIRHIVNIPHARYHQNHRISTHVTETPPNSTQEPSPKKKPPNYPIPSAKTADTFFSPM